MSKEMLGFSVIIPTYNRAYILGEAINSVYSQREKVDLEVVVVDDGSADATDKLVDNYHDRRIKYYRQPNRGPSAARNLGLEKATKEWVVYLDSDNTLYPNYFEVVSEVIHSYPAVFYAMVRALKTYELYEGGKLTKTKEDRDNNLPQITVQDLLSQKVYFDVNGFFHKRDLVRGIRWDEGLRRLEDWEFFMQLAEKYPGNFGYIAQPLVDYRMRFGTDGILSNTTYREWAEAYEYVFVKHKNDNVLRGQTWYPAKVEYYQQKQIDFEAGKLPPPHLRLFV